MNREQQYIKAFNNGYFLAQYEPTIHTVVVQNVSPTNLYLSGLLDGLEQFTWEKSKEQLHALTQCRNRANHRINSIEPEREV